MSGAAKERGGQSCCPAAADAMTEAEAEELARRLKAIADPARLRLLSLIGAHVGNEACVGDLTECMGLSQPTVSHHLKVLEEARFVSRSKRGVFVYYALEPHAVGILGQQVEAACC